MYDPSHDDNNVRGLPWWLRLHTSTAGHMVQCLELKIPPCYALRPKKKSYTNNNYTKQSYLRKGEVDHRPSAKHIKMMLKFHRFKQLVEEALDPDSSQTASSSGTDMVPRHCLRGSGSGFYAANGF